MDGIGRDGEDGADGEVVAADCDAGPGGDDAWEAKRGGRVDAEGFLDRGCEAVGL